VYVVIIISIILACYIIVVTHCRYKLSTNKNKKYRSQESAALLTKKQEAFNRLNVGNS